MITRTSLLLFLLTACACSQARLTDTAWSVYDLLKTSPLVALGAVSGDYTKNIPGHRVFSVTVIDSLTAPATTSGKLYVITGDPAFGASSAPMLSSQKYLLFLTPLDEADWQAVRADGTPLERENTFKITGLWKGAVGLDYGLHELSNRVIRKQYGAASAQQVQSAVRQVVSFLQTGAPARSDNPIAAEFFQKFYAAPFIVPAALGVPAMPAAPASVAVSSLPASPTR